MTRRTLTAIVVGEFPSYREDVQRQIDPKRERYMVISPGQQTGGHRFDLIIVTESYRRDWNYAALPRAEKMSRWLNDDVFSRLTPTARVVHF